MVTKERVSWVLLAYKVPREPSTPRIAIWRRLKKLGVAQLADGLVALPADARTQEQLEWTAEAVAEAGGTSTLWHAELATRNDERALVGSLQESRTAEYDALVERIEQALTAPDPVLSARVLRSARRELREIQRRDYFPPPARARARTALTTLAQQVQRISGLQDVQP